MEGEVGLTSYPENAHSHEEGVRRLRFIGEEDLLLEFDSHGGGGGEGGKAHENEL